jgi:hypothetical protein
VQSAEADVHGPANATAGSPRRTTAAKTRIVHPVSIALNGSWWHGVFATASPAGRPAISGGAVKVRPHSICEKLNMNGPLELVPVAQEAGVT